jgi:hypothetical protein
MMEKSITRQRLKQIDTKGQTHDQLTKELIKAKRNSQDSIDSGFASHSVFCFVQNSTTFFGNKGLNFLGRFFLYWTYAIRAHPKSGSILVLVAF